MNTMVKLKYTFILILGVLLYASCTKKDNFVSNIENGKNIALFTNTTKSAANISDGTEYPVEVRMQVQGPSVMDLTGDVNLTVEPDMTGIPDSMKAVSGTNFRIDNNKLTLKESDRYIGKYKFTMLTKGITAPTKRQLKLKVTDASGSDNVINSGKPISVTLSYACDSNLQGVYNVQVTRDDGNVYSFSNEKVTKIGVGKYQTETVGQFGNPPMNYGVTFSDSCGELTVQAESSTGGYYSNDIIPGASTTVNGNAQTGNLTSFTLKYSMENYHSYTAVYTKQ